jgi:hypothetical protein
MLRFLLLPSRSRHRLCVRHERSVRAAGSAARAHVRHDFSPFVTAPRQVSPRGDTPVLN